VQFWATDFLITVINGEKNMVRLSFIVTSATAPLLGVFVGGWLVDRMGGYQGAAETANTLRTCVIFGTIGQSLHESAVLLVPLDSLPPRSCTACFFSFPVTYLNDLWSVIAFLWYVLLSCARSLPTDG
jgi:hypothetical protein